MRGGGVVVRKEGSGSDKDNEGPKVADMEGLGL